MRKNQISSRQRGDSQINGRNTESTSPSTLTKAVLLIAGLLGKKIGESFHESLRGPVSPHDGRSDEAHNPKSTAPKNTKPMNIQPTQNAEYKTASGRLAFRFTLRKQRGCWRIYVTKQVSWIPGITRRQLWSNRTICSETPFFKLKDAYRAAAVWAEQTEALMTRRFA